MGSVVMVIDDDYGVANLLAILLKSHGYTVITASSAKNAINTLSSCPTPSLILTDYCMPFLSGCEFTELIYEQNDLKEVPVVIITGSLVEDLTLPTTANFCGIIQKPFKTNSVLEVVHALIGDKHLDTVNLA